MIIDVNAYLGDFAFRRLPYRSAEELLRLMDRHGIDRAIVSSAAAITYRNPSAGNDDVARETQAHRDRLIPWAVINPFYAGWEDDLAAAEELGMTGLRLYPKWHHYEFSDSSCRELLAAAAERRLPVGIPLRVEDYRQRSWLVDVPDLTTAEVAAVVRAHPRCRFILLNGANYIGSPLGQRNAGQNYLIEISRLEAVLDDEIGQLLRQLGRNRVVFGTGMPFNSPGPSLVKLDVLSADAETKKAILSENIQSWLSGS